MKRLVFLAVTLVSGAVLAQVTLAQISIRRVDDATSETYTFAAGQCADTLNIRWSNNGVVTQLCSSFRVWATEGECDDAPGTGDVRYEDVSQLTFQSIRAGQFTVKISELPGFANAAANADGGTVLTCGSDRYSKSHRICGNIDTSFNGCVSVSKLAASGLRLVYDTLPPGPPTLGEVTAQDEAVRVAFTADSDTSVVLVEAKAADAADYVQVGEAPVVNAFVRGTGLKNGVRYDVRLRGRDAAGNVSDPSASGEVTPIRTVGFWGYYKEAGGTDGQGCSVGIGLAPLALALWALRRARRQARNEP